MAALPLTGGALAPTISALLLPFHTGHPHRCETRRHVAVLCQVGKKGGLLTGPKKKKIVLKPHEIFSGKRQCC